MGIFIKSNDKAQPRRGKAVERSESQTLNAVGCSVWFEHETGESPIGKFTIYKNVPKYTGQLPDPYASESGPQIPVKDCNEQT